MYFEKKNSNICNVKGSCCFLLFGLDEILEFILKDK